jgi:ankyrin repeat protein
MPVDYFELIRKKEPSVLPLLASLDDLDVRLETGDNMLHVAIAYHNLAAAAELIRIGIKVSAQNMKGETPLHYAASHLHTDVLEQILANGGDVSSVDRHGNTVLWAAVLNPRVDYRAAQLLLEYGAGQFARLKNKHGRSPMEMAVDKHDDRLIQLLGRADGA